MTLIFSLSRSADWPPLLPAREARARGVSVAALVREAVDARFSTITPEQRRQAYERIASMRAEAPPIEELNELIDARFDDEARPDRHGQ